jgi:hypothetical protein
MQEGLRVLPQPPWYVGYSNTTVPADSNYLMAANRYGYRGSRAIQQFNTKRYELPAKTSNPFMPKFLTRNEEFVDEYVPAIQATTQQTINCLETPKLWPENTYYVEGYRYKQRPKSWIYRRETTVDQPERPRSPGSLAQLTAKALGEKDALCAYALQETQGTLLSHGGSARRQFEASWSNQVRRSATTSLKQSLRKASGPYEASTLSDCSDSLRYCGSSALIVHSQSTEELQLRLRMQRSRAKVDMPHELKWKHVMAHFSSVKAKLRRQQSMATVLDKIAQSWHSAALEAGCETSLRRADFVQVCGRISFFEDVSAKQMGQLYSLFDPARRDSVRYCELLLRLLVLDQPELGLEQKLRALWQCATRYGRDRSSLEVALEVLTCCAASREDLQRIEAAFRDEFRPRCYELALAGQLQQQQQVTSICEGLLSGQVLVEVLQACPTLLKELDAQLSARLRACYGRDGRQKECEQVSPGAAEALDFSWIMKREAPPREVFGLY